MDAWYYFWLITFALAALAFAGILVVVAVKGTGDLRHMLTALRKDNDQ